MLRALARRANWVSTSSQQTSNLFQFSSRDFCLCILSDGVDRTSEGFSVNAKAMDGIISELQSHVKKGLAGGGPEAIERNKSRNKLLPRERIDHKLDPGSSFLELSQLAGHELYEQPLPSAGKITGIGPVHGRLCMFVANDPTVKGGTYYPSQAAGVLTQIERSNKKKNGIQWDKEEEERLKNKVIEAYEREGSCYYSTSRLWDDGVIDPADTRKYKLEGNENWKKEIDVDVLFLSCTNVYLAKRLHALLLATGKVQNVFLSAKLVNLYAYLGEISLSRKAFDRIRNKDIYTWNSMVSAYVRSGHFVEAVNCFYEFILTSSIHPDFYTFPPVVKACRNVTEGKKIHCWVLKLGFEWDVFVAASLIHMYSRFCLVSSAIKLFDHMPVRDVGSWNAMISGFCQNGNAAKALEVLDEMRLKGIEMDPITVSSLLPICAQSDDKLSGILIHLYVIKHGLEFDLFVSNALINLYAKFGSLGSALKVFNHMKIKDLVSWNSLIAAYEQNNDPVTGLEFFNKMMDVGIEPDMFTLVSLGSIASQCGDFDMSRCVHAYVTRRGWLLEHAFVGNSVMDMYAKLGSMILTKSVFEQLPVKDVIAWNTLITGYAQNGLAGEAIEVYQIMEQCKDIIPNQGTWVSLLTAYSHLGALQQGMKIHGLAIKKNLYSDIYMGTCLFDMYGKCGKLDDALSLFHLVPQSNAVPWNAIISCHGIHGHSEKALELFKEMQAKGVLPDHITFVSLLSACSHSGLVDSGLWCFKLMQEDYGMKPSLKHYCCMVDLFGRAGQLNKAYSFVKNMPVQPDASVWGALLGACRIHGNVELGKFASEQLFEVDPENVGYYVLMSNIYANYGKWEGVNKVRSLARDKGLKKTPGWSSVELNNKVEVFYAGNQTHPQLEEILVELRVLTAKMKNLGYIPDYNFVLQDVEDDEKEQVLTYHSERLAIAFAIISTPPRTPIRIFKNLRVCGDCHNATKFISRITERQIIVRDSNRFHHFQDDICSCGDYW